MKFNPETHPGKFRCEVCRARELGVMRFFYEYSRCQRTNPLSTRAFLEREFWRQIRPRRGSLIPKMLSRGANWLRPEKLAVRR